jgi:hypothetical protein
VNAQLYVTECTFGKLTSIYRTWYFWRSGNILHVSDAEVFNDRNDEDCYSSHMKNTLVLLIAAIHQRRPGVFGNRLRPLELNPQEPSMAMAVAKSLKDTLYGFAWKFTSGCWAWVSASILNETRRI